MVTGSPTVTNAATNPRPADRAHIPDHTGARTRRSAPIRKLFSRYGPSGAQNRRYAAAIVPIAVPRSQVTAPPCVLKKIQSGTWLGVLAKCGSRGGFCESSGRSEGRMSARVLALAEALW